MVVLDTLGSISILHADSAFVDYDGTAPAITFGRGNPNGELSGYKGQIYIDLDGVPGKVFYVKETPPYGTTKGGWQSK